ncbi:MAG TPA: UDP-glucuronic acid decarboxylase family protein [Patescibacteria group bacterium]|nr:UDP-glucuronic acid decarboxylase family protein [Patescibacteria group bacterium]
MSTVVVLGGAGFVGSHLVERLLNEGKKVICIDNFLTGSESNVEKFLENPNFVFIKHDLIHSLPSINGQVDVVFHLASPASPNAKSPKSYIAYPIETLMVNSVGTKNALEFAHQKNAKFVYASSSEIYGDPAVSPQKEDYFGNVNPNGPRSVYDEGKRFGEAICSAYARKYKLDVRVIRIFNTYGTRMQKDDGRVVSNFINQALRNEDITIYGDGDQTRSFCYVDDLIAGLIGCLDVESGFYVINLGNPDEHTIADLASKIKEMVGSSSKIVHEDLPMDDPHRRKPDIAYAKELFGFEPKIKLDTGLAKTIEYFKTSI